jgi:hypothetical protein
MINNNLPLARDGENFTALKQQVIAIAAAALFAIVGSASASAQEDCGSMYQRVMGAYQAQSPYYNPDARPL